MRIMKALVRNKHMFLVSSVSFLSFMACRKGPVEWIKFVVW